jgi:hypothetical protein
VPVNDYAVGNTYLTGNHFPAGVVFFLLFLVLVVNMVLRVFGTRWTLKQPELMLVCCMMLVASTVPASGLMRYWFPITASAPYLSQRSDLFWKDSVLQQAPRGILLSKTPRSPVAKKFYEGTRKGEVVRVPWRQWLPVIVTWGIFIWLYYLATIFLFGILRKQWVESERLIYAVARVPLEFTEGAGEGPWWGLPVLMRNKFFLIGAAVTVAFGLMRLSPLLFGADTGWLPAVPVSQFLSDTDWWRVGMRDGYFFPIAIGFAFLVPADVSLSIWLFYLLANSEVMAFFYAGSPLEGNMSSPFMYYQQAGAFIAFAVCMIYMARRHLWAVLRKAFGKGPDVDDSAEPVGYALAFWLFVAAMAGMVVWYYYFKMPIWGAVLLLALEFTIVLVHARLVTQGGLFFTQQGWSPPEVLYGITGGRAYTAPAIVVAHVQHALLTYDSREIFSPHVANAFRISSVFRRGRRLLVPIILVTLLVAMIASGYSTMKWVYFKDGALNLPNRHSTVDYPLSMFNKVHTMLANPTQVPKPSYGGLIVGASLMFALTILRTTLYWWPIHPLGLAVASSWCATQLYFSFFLGWLTKVLILKFAGGQVLRGARMFFLGVIVAESGMICLSTLVSLLTGVRTGYIFLSG